MVTICEDINRDCAGNVYKTDMDWPSEAIDQMVSKVTGPSRHNCVGLRERGMWVMLSVSRVPGFVSTRQFQYIEITRVEVDKAQRGTGLFKRFELSVPNYTRSQN